MGLITIDDPDKVYYFGVEVGMPILSYFVIFSKKNKYRENMTAVDFVFKTKYILKIIK